MGSQPRTCPDDVDLPARGRDDTDQRHLAGELHFVDIAIENTWSVPLQQINVGEQVIPIGKVALVATDTLYMVAPLEYVKTLARIFSAKEEQQGIYLVNCDAVTPDITLVVGSVPLVLFRTEYVLRWNDACLLALIGLQGAEECILGMPLLRKYYPVFDADEHHRFWRGQIEKTFVIVFKSSLHGRWNSARLVANYEPRLDVSKENSFAYFSCKSHESCLHPRRVISKSVCTRRPLIVRYIFHATANATTSRSVSTYQAA
ncbi:unnamed protein product [Phytophthora lilii]|uniref:Unnamed protein product n=1 Tax=Phytophthora lilii TaxID=2077276 RepID=A0A9W6U2Q9_9STRA|nr:unnamed protein product [Phytophthora lilii]